MTNNTITSNTFSTTTNGSDVARTSNVRLLPPSILSKSNDWGSCTQRHSANKVCFDSHAELRFFKPNLPEGKEMYPTRKATRDYKRKQAFWNSLAQWATREHLKSWVATHLRRVEANAQVGPMDMDIDDPEPVNKLKRKSSFAADARPTKRRKMTISSSSIIKEWVQTTNLLHKPRMPVIIEGLGNEEVDDEDELSEEDEESDDSKYDYFSDDDSQFSVMDDEEDGFGDENDGTSAPQEDHSPLTEIDDEDDDDDDDEDEVSQYSALDDEKDGISDENETSAPREDHSPLAETDADLSDDDVSHEDSANDQAVPPAESTTSIEFNSTTIEELGSGWTESGKRFSLRLAKRDAEEEPSGSGMTKDGRRFSRRVASRKNNIAS